jgi:hypothetical protein
MDFRVDRGEGIPWKELFFLVRPKIEPYGTRRKVASKRKT